MMDSMNVFQESLADAAIMLSCTRYLQTALFLGDVHLIEITLHSLIFTDIQSQMLWEMKCLAPPKNFLNYPKHVIHTSVFNISVSM